MVQGDLSIFNINHAITAAKTGFASAVAIVVVSLLFKIPNRWAMAWLTGVVVMIVDLCIHPTHFGEFWTEAAVTGAGAALLGLMLSGKLYDTTTTK